MSVRSKLVEVVCDGPAWNEDCPESAAWTDYGTAKDLRQRMRSAGWRTSLAGGLDECPDCVAARAAR